ncbi:GntR family transcriptional regulator [Actinomycetaceae bacterium TAE3-ERU4]|nr:GntR family transcriptional regulator [Actinomycetaceae bacterium TAE3-ERU4]
MTDSATVSRSRSGATVDAIKELILRENLRPGDSLPTELTLCEQLGVSRSSVREAIRKLETLDIVSVEHGRGTYVGSLSLAPLVQTLAFRSLLACNDNFEGLRNVVQVRRCLDLGCAEEVVNSLKGTSQPRLHELVNQMIERAQKGELFQEMDIEFHLGLLSKISNVVIEQLVHSLWLVHMVVIPRLGIEIAVHLEETALAHKQMLDAALAGDAEAYRQAVIEHYRPLEEILYKHVD